MEFILVNGKIAKKEEINISSLLFNSPLTLSQKIWFGFGGIPLFNENIDTISEQLAIIDIEVPRLFRNRQELFRLTKRLLNKNKLYRSGYVTFQFLHSGSKTNYIVTCQAFTSFDFPFSKKGKLLNYSEFIKFSASKNTNYQLFNNLFWKQAETTIKNSAFDNSIIFNEFNSVCETIGANLFLIRDNLLITPSEETGCYCDLFRKIVIDTAFKLGYKIIESSKIHKKDLLAASEIFMASEKQGIEWVVGIENKRFIHNESLLIYNKLNDYLKSLID